MVIIEVENSFCTIKGLSEHVNNILYDELSYEEDDSIHVKRKNKNLIWVDLRKRLYQPKRGKFNTGLLERVKDILDGEGVEYILEEKRDFPEKYNYFALKKPLNEMRYYQTELHEIIKTNKVVAASLCTGSGKTLSIMQAIQEIGVNALIIVPTLNLKEQFLEELELHFGTKQVGTHEVDDVEDLKPIVIANIQGLQNKDKSFFDHFDFLIIDEYHHQAADSYYDLNKTHWQKIPYRLSLSATAFRNDNKDLKLEAIAGQVQYHYSAKQAIKDGFIVPPKFLLYDFKFPIMLSQGWHADYKNLMVNNKPRNKIILNLVKKFLSSTNKNILILCNRIEHVNLLAQEIPDAIIVTGETKNNEKTFADYRLGKIRCMLATSQVVSEGVNIPNIDILFIAGGYESEIMISQAVGRIVRLDPERNKRYGIVVDIMDKGHEVFQRHAESRFKLYKEEYGKEHVKVMKDDV